MTTSNLPNEHDGLILSTFTEKIANNEVDEYDKNSEENAHYGSEPNIK